MRRYGPFRVLAGAAAGVLAGLLVGILVWAMILFVSGFPSSFTIRPSTFFWASALFVMPIALAGLFAGLSVGRMLPRGSKVPPSLAPEKHRRLRFVVFFALGIVALLCCCVATVAVTVNLPLIWRGDWPQPLKELLEGADRKQIKVEQIVVYDCSDPWGSETFFWQTKDSAGVLVLMTESWGLSSIGKSDWMVERFWWEMPWALRRSCDPNKIEYFANLGRGDRFLVMHDKARGLLVVRYRAPD